MKKCSIHSIYKTSPLFNCVNHHYVSLHLAVVTHNDESHVSGGSSYCSQCSKLRSVERTEWVSQRGSECRLFSCVPDLIKQDLIWLSVINLNHLFSLFLLICDKKSHTDSTFTQLCKTMKHENWDAALIICLGNYNNGFVCVPDKQTSRSRGNNDCHFSEAEMEEARCCYPSSSSENSLLR